MYGLYQPTDGLWVGPGLVLFGLAFGIAMARQAYRRARARREHPGGDPDPDSRPFGIGSALGLAGIAVGMVLLGGWILVISLNEL